MVAPLAVLGFVGVGLAKTAAAVWFSSRATSPLSEEWRKEYLNHAESGINTLEKLKLSNDEQVASLHGDIELLQEHLHLGWGDPKVFDAACRVSTYLAWMHTTTGIAGIAGLAGGYANRHLISPLESMFEGINRWADDVLDSITPHDPEDPDKSKDPPHDDAPQ